MYFQPVPLYLTFVWLRYHLNNFYWIVFKYCINELQYETLQFLSRTIIHNNSLNNCPEQRLSFKKKPFVKLAYLTCYCSLFGI